MKEKEFNTLKKGDIVISKGRRARVYDLGYTLVEIQYLDTYKKVWKTSRQIVKKEG